MPLSKFKIASNAAALVLAVACWTTLLRADVTDDLRVILDGVRASRLELREGSIQIEVKDDLLFDSHVEEYVLSVEWKDDSLRFVEVLSDGTERRCSIRYNGELMFRQQGYGGALDDAAKGYGYFLFDPRVIGAYPILTPSLNATECLFPSTGWEIELLNESEMVDGHECVAIRWKKTGVAQDYWIERGGGFRVRRIVDHNNRTWTQSSYSDSHVFPITVTVTKLSNEGGVLRRTDFNLASFQTDPVSPEVFSLAGLGLEVGTGVIDQRLHRTVGYWNGTDLSSARGEALRVASSFEPRTSRSGRWIMLSVGLAAMVALLMMLRSRFKPLQD